MVKNFEDTFIRFDVIHKRDGQTPHADIYRAYAYASCGKNYKPICIISEAMQYRQARWAFFERFLQN